MTDKLVKITDTQMFWMDGYGNYPDLRIVIDLEGVPLNFIYERRGYTYYAEDRGLVRFYYYARPATGFGGSTFELSMRDGTTAKLIGPCSSNGNAVHRDGFPLTVSSAYKTVDEADYCCGMAIHLAIPLAIEACKKFNETSERKVALALVDHYSSRKTDCIFVEFIEVIDGALKPKGSDAEVKEVYYKP